MPYINYPPNLKDIFDNIMNRLGKLETAVRFTAPNVATNPTNPRTGDNWLNTATNKLQYLDATSTTQTIVKENSPTLTGTVDTSAATLTSPTFSGTVTSNAAINGVIGGAVVIQMVNDANGSIELGKINGTGTTPFIDFHANATPKDYDVRLIASSGGALAGQGTLTVNAGNFNLAGLTTASTVGAAGGASALPATPLGYLILQINGTSVKLPYYNI